MLEVSEERIGLTLEENIKKMNTLYAGDETLVIRAFQNKHVKALSCVAFYISGMVDIHTMNEGIIRAVQEDDPGKSNIREGKLEYLKDKVLNANQIRVTGNFQEMAEGILNGDTALFIDGVNQGMIINTKGWSTRSITEPISEIVVRGPREGFNECLMVNLSLIRRKLQTPDLKFQFREIGDRIHTKICIVYLEAIAYPKLIQEINDRLDKISIDGIFDSGYIQELIKDEALLPFKTIGNTERPDVVAAKLLEGRAAIIVDGSPSALTMPFLYMEYFQFNEDYYNNYYITSINRMLRIISVLITIYLPGIYVAFLTFHQEMIPTPLLLSIALARNDIPFPTVVEALVMSIVFEIIRESSVRMPAPLGQTMSIIGAIVLGQAAVDAKIVSAPMVILVALTGITGLTLPKLKGPNIIMRFSFLILGGSLGIYGITFGMIAAYLIMFSMYSFGVPYMLNVNLIHTEDFKDTMIRAPWWTLYKRPEKIGEKNPIRQKKMRPIKRKDEE